MTPPRPYPTSMGAELVAAAIAVAHVALVIGMIAMRLGYAFELEWLEGACLDHVARLRDGRSLYVEPDAEWVPFLYTPASFYLGAASSSVFGDGFLALRVVSIVAIAVAVACLAVITRRVNTSGRRTTWTPLVAVGLFAGTYAALAATCWDVGRVDAPFLAGLALASVVVLRPGGVRSGVVAGLLLVATCFTKQSALACVPAFAVVAALTAAPGDSTFVRAAWRRGAAVAAGFAVPTALLVWLAQTSTDGWFLHYVWTIPRAHGVEIARLEQLFRDDLQRFAPAALLTIVFVVQCGTRGRAHAADTLAWLAWLGGMVGCAVLSRLHPGGEANVLVPAHFACAAVAVAAVTATSPKTMRGVGCRMLLVGQLALLVVDPRGAVPNDDDRAANERIVELLRSAGDDGATVFVPSHPYLVRRAGLVDHAHENAVVDIVRALAPDAPTAHPLWTAYLDRGRGAGNTVVVLDEPLAAPLWAPLLGARTPAGFAHDLDAGWPPAGLRTRPRIVLR